LSGIDDRRTAVVGPEERRPSVVRRPGLSDAEDGVMAARPQALIAAISDLLPTMLMTRVRM
jgi:hypothetical protein